MARKLFSEEEITALRESPCVECANSKAVRFTAEFKSIACAMISSGKSIRDILSEHGIDPQMLGDARISGLAQSIRRQAKREAVDPTLQERDSARRNSR